jgi:hypothetical protein
VARSAWFESHSALFDVSGVGPSRDSSKELEGVNSNPDLSFADISEHNIFTCVHFCQNFDMFDSLEVWWQVEYRCIHTTAERTHPIRYAYMPLGRNHKRPC